MPFVAIFPRTCFAFGEVPYLEDPVDQGAFRRKVAIRRTEFRRAHPARASQSQGRRGGSKGRGDYPAMHGEFLGAEMGSRPKSAKYPVGYVTS